MLLILIICLSILGIIYLNLRRKALVEVPKTFPQAGKIDRSIAHGKKLIICAGDSITHGNMGANYVERLEKQLPEYVFINAGRNADLTYTLLNRLDAIIEYQPDSVTLLIGTNDIQASINETKRKDYVSYGKITKDDFPSFDTFRENYQTIIRRLKTETKATIAVASLPVISENLSHEVNQKADLYSDFIKQTAQNQHLTYLPVRETMKDFLAQNTSTHKYVYENAYWLMNLSMIKHYVLGQSWDKICQSYGNLLTHDMLHFNSKGAEIIEKLIEKFLRN